MAFSETMAVGGKSASKSFPNITNTKIKDILIKYCFSADIPTEGKTDEQIMEAILADNVRRYREGAKQVDLMQKRKANDAAILAGIESDNTIA